MKQWKNMSKFVRLLVCFCILGMACLFLGAVKVRDGMKSHRMECEEALMSCRSAVASLKNGVPETQKEGWTRLVQQDPELCLKLTCGKLSRLDERDNP